LKEGDKFEINEAVFTHARVQPIKVPQVGYNIPSARTIQENGQTVDVFNNALVVDGTCEKGQSGTPVFLVEREGQTIVPMLIGVVCARSWDGKTLGIAPIGTTVAMVHTSLDLNDVAQHFGTLDKSHTRSVLSHLSTLGAIGDYVGSIPRPPTRRASAFRFSEFYPAVREAFPAIESYTVPHLNPHIVKGVWVNPLLACFRQFSQCGVVVCPQPFADAARLVTRHIIKHINLDEVGLFNTDQVICGTSYTTPMNRKGSLGYGYSGVKDELVAGVKGGAVFKAWAAERILVAIEELDRGSIPYNIASASVKDEIISSTKDEEGGQRIFFAGNWEYLVLCRYFLSPLMEQFMAHRDVLFGQIGMNATGREFGDRIRRMMGHVGESANDTLTPMFIDTDYSKYDKSLYVVPFAVDVLKEVITCTKMSQTNKRRCHRVLDAMQSYILEANGDFFVMHDKLPSGVFGTAWLNCVCEAILEVVQFHLIVRMATQRSLPDADEVHFIRKQAPDWDFFTEVALINYGDDNLKCLSTRVRSFYTHERISAAASWMKMKITPAEKHETRICLKSFMNVTFLKRQPRPIVTNSGIVFVGALDVRSIWRMLAFRDTEQEDWASSVITTAQREWAAHGPDRLKEFQDVLRFGGFGYFPKLTYQELAAAICENADYLTP
jgi:hypothetical protein